MPPPKSKNQLIQRASEGSVADIHLLAEYALENQDHDTAIFSPLLHLLDPALIPSHQETKTRRFKEDPNNSVKVAMHVLAVIVAVCGGLGNNLGTESAALPATRLLANHIPHICQWAHFFVREGVYIGPTGSLILTLVVLHRELRDAIITSPFCVDLLLSMWMCKGADGRLVVVTACTLCPLLGLLQTLVDNEDGKTVLYDILGASKSKLKKLACVIVCRMENIADLHTRKHVSTSFAMLYMAQLLDLTLHLVEEQNHWAAFFKSDSFLSALPSALLSIARVEMEANAHPKASGTEVESNARIWEDIVACVRYIVTFCFTCGMGTISPLRQVSHALDGGALTLISKCLTNLPPSHPEFSYALKVYGDFLAYTVYERTMGSFIPANQVMTTALVKSLGEQSQEFQHMMCGLKATVSSALGVYNGVTGKRVGERVCDNLHLMLVDNLYLVDFLFPYGACTIRIFARLWRDRNGAFYALSSIFTILESDMDQRKRHGKTARELRDHQASKLWHFNDVLN
ncbi:hypothetical protein EST38_g10155 [Candolleomyces aberdarensis]|uniref:Uncharacterized protein n=1 Tax=Candolleomyces aberdarensis TaxID=2316362 RepID=A0A4Q2D8S8_9AGAR|nr:hypothetical protein EST38_g10155 [Candolleomyces aberdarensis]